MKAWGNAHDADSMRVPHVSLLRHGTVTRHSIRNLTSHDERMTKPPQRFLRRHLTS